MATEDDDVPLGEAGRSYYENKFGERIRRVSRGAPARPASPAPAGPGKASTGRGVGAVIFIVVVVGMRIFSGLSDRSPTRNRPAYTPPPPPQHFNNVFEDLERAQKEMEARPLNLPDALGPVDEGVKADDWLLDEDDIPLPAGLCYRIVQESLRPGPAPGKRIWDNLDREGRILVRRAADADDRELNAQELAGLVQALNAVLQDAGFYDEASFRDVPQPHQVQRAAVEWQRGVGGQAAERTIKFNRRILEAAYPEQIVPNSEHRIDDQARLEWRRRAVRDLADARRQFGK